MRSVAFLHHLIVATVIATIANPVSAQHASGEYARGDRESARRSATTEESCTLRKGVRRTVTSIIDAETVKLDDGSAVRLIGVLAPSAIDAGQATGYWPLEIEARAFLQTLILGKTVQLANADASIEPRAEIANGKERSNDARKRRGTRRQPEPSERDRHGRILAHLFLGDDADTSVWVQAAMLRAGLARASILPGHDSCLREMVLHEATARRARLGLWSNRLYRIKRAEPGPGLMRFRNRYELVRGQVANVTVTRAATYINFGADWRRDFTIRIDKALRAKHPEWSRMLPALKGKTVMVRGWIERRNGPEIKLWSPDQIEIDDDHTTAQHSPATRGRSVPEIETGDRALTPDRSVRDTDPFKTKPAHPNIDSNAPAEMDL